MPFLRILRDKRGYETSYLMHWFREGHRQRSRVLYVFRTPGGVRVGRTPLDREVLRELEARYPDIAFDWDSVRENQQIVEAAPERRRRPRGDGEVAAPGTPVASETAAAPQGPAPAAPPSAPAHPPLPAAIDGATPDEQIAFLTTWYPLVRDRITHRPFEPERRDALMALAERLNPAAWTDADQITTGLQHAAEALERLARVFSRRKRRQRKRARTDRASEAGAPPPAAASESTGDESIEEIDEPEAES